jgi:hypothetical protein
MYGSQQKEEQDILNPGVTQQAGFIAEQWAILHCVELDAHCLQLRQFTITHYV